MSDIPLLTGAGWGLAGAIAMAIMMHARGGDDPPPFAGFWAKFLGDGNPGATMPQALSLHAIYAIVAGAVYTLVFNPVGVSLGLALTGITGSIVWGILYAIVLLVGAMVLWGKIGLDLDPGGEPIQTIALAHLAYGSVRGILAAVVPHLR